MNSNVLLSAIKTTENDAKCISSAVVIYVKLMGNESLKAGLGLGKLCWHNVEHNRSSGA